MRVPEEDILHMVGLDAYMLIRYHIVSIKLCIFLSFWGLIVLLPMYYTVHSSSLSGWGKYTILNIRAGDPDAGFRFWITAVFAYIFAAYFCQLLYVEYDNFSILRLSYLIKTDDVSKEKTDPNIFPQRYYSVMIEKIPIELRSADKLYEYFDELFPGYFIFLI